MVTDLSGKEWLWRRICLTPGSQPIYGEVLLSIVAGMVGKVSEVKGLVSKFWRIASNLHKLKRTYKLTVQRWVDPGWTSLQLACQYTQVVHASLQRNGWKTWINTPQVTENYPSKHVIAGFYTLGLDSLWFNDCLVMVHDNNQTIIFLQIENSALYSISIHSLLSVSCVAIMIQGCSWLDIMLAFRGRKQNLPKVST